ncbi:MAG: hypothetical protein OI715_00335 (plasmid) [Candidatus Methanoperedens sp.]|nr:MAG: hypothetical protein OI715_00335 [Candidatus Methanoperedens sp.]
MSETKLEYLFSWDEIPGKDSDKLVEFLRDMDVKWVKKAKIEKVDNGDTIKIFNEKKSLLLKLNNEKTEASLTIDDDVLEFIVKAENGKLNLYHEKVEIVAIMPELPEQKSVPIGNEEELIKFIRESTYGKRHFQERLQAKIEWENEAWNLLNSNIGRLNPEILNKIFDLFGDWWGQLLIKPTRNKIFSTPNDKLNNWFNYLLNGEELESVRIEKCLVDPKYKLNGAGKGLVTLLLYLKNPNSFNVMMKTTIAGLEKLGRFESKQGKRKWRDYYNDYNTAAINFRNRYDLKPQSVDWILDSLKRLGIHRTENGTFIRYEDKETTDPTKEPNPPEDRLTVIFKQAIEELGLKEGRYIDDVILKMKQIADNKREQLSEGWEETVREKIENEWASNKLD